MPKKSKSLELRDFLYLLMSSALLAFAVAAFSAPNNIVPTGVTGLATLIYASFGIPIGMTVLIVNVFLIFAQTKLVGAKTAKKTIFVIVLSSIMTDFLMKVVQIPAATNDINLATLYGSVLTGLGIGLAFKAGGTTGGTDIINQILQVKAKVPLSYSMLLSNSVVLAFTGFKFGMSGVLYSLIYLFISSKILDVTIEGMTVFRTVFVISNEAERIGTAIVEELRRGATCLDGRGIYSGKNVGFLVTAIKKGELPALQTLIYSFDPKAFVIVNESRQVLGTGFSKLQDEVRFNFDEVSLAEYQAMRAQKEEQKEQTSKQESEKPLLNH
ncbi:MAG: YitT family protein [Candidatus Riflebacteria bacterium]|nr:YitT family protein [Candidatus Riflebacteria bacterium]